ncbi:MAG TPA: hypothetical protein VGT03_00280 [Candidatus Acidoferrales bacterium]|nr:hypothetical protein [Candidatus Acidoferrales bacterium]
MSTNSPATRKSPICPGSLLVKEARDLYLAANGFRVQDYDASTFTIGTFGIPVKYPNIPSRKRAIPLHDLHHVLTGYDTSWIGEAEIGAWELRAGCNSFITYYLNGWGVIIGLFISPRRVWRAFRAARGQRTLYRDPLPYDRLLEMTVSALRVRLGIPSAGLVP